jgi:hypothetical protein
MLVQIQDPIANPGFSSLMKQGFHRHIPPLPLRAPSLLTERALQLLGIVRHKHYCLHKEITYSDPSVTN